MINNIITEDLKEKMLKLGIDIELSKTIMDNYNKGLYDKFVPIKAKDLPDINGESIIDISKPFEKIYDYEEAQKRIDELDLSCNLKEIGELRGSKIYFNQKALAILGMIIYPLLSYGVLNGGSASSYVDRKKNKKFNEKLLDLFNEEFSSIESDWKGKAKGISPAFINEDGSYGPGFLELKMRSLLIESMRYQLTFNNKNKALWPMFQMTSIYNNDEIEKEYNTYKKSIYLKELIQATDIDITSVKTGIQPMLSAFTHSSFGKPKTFFKDAYDKPDNPLPMPGGHGQMFIVLKEIFKELHKSGKRFIYLGNVDNLGYTVDPICLALLALSNKQGAFEFTFRTSVDIKGGILVVDQFERLNCADIGVAISKEEMLNMEKAGKNILFNCAIGLFNLNYLISNSDQIISRLPVRFTDQDKEAGKYSQAEQITWEILSIMNDYLVLCVDKYSRFLAAKHLLEGLMTSGIKLEHPEYPTHQKSELDVKHLAERLHNGLKKLLLSRYGMKKERGRWIPCSVNELKKEILKTI